MRPHRRAMDCGTQPEELQGEALAENYSGDKTAPKPKVIAVGSPSKSWGSWLHPTGLGKKNAKAKTILKPYGHEICTIGFSMSLGPVTASPSLVYFPLRNRKPILYLLHHYSLKICDLFALTGSQVEKKFSSE